MKQEYHYFVIQLSRVYYSIISKGYQNRVIHVVIKFFSYLKAYFYGEIIN